MDRMVPNVEQFKEQWITDYYYLLSNDAQSFGGSIGRAVACLRRQGMPCTPPLQKRGGHSSEPDRPFPVGSLV